eukprot:comp22217_c0_seq1/m.52525 comp22217_c0_seq1/g.52525  ORF comp22217_c0_seq1/g.52525 comp22217_c0_seq1/m.52525 type:complete len:311 (-) comp22217_c0_seq1:191-1123(-)
MLLQTDCSLQDLSQAAAQSRSAIPRTTASTSRRHTAIRPQEAEESVVMVTVHIRPAVVLGRSQSRTTHGLRLHVAARAASTTRVWPTTTWPCSTTIRSSIILQSSTTKSTPRSRISSATHGAKHWHTTTLAATTSILATSICRWPSTSTCCTWKSHPCPANSSPAPISACAMLRSPIAQRAPMPCVWPRSISRPHCAMRCACPTRSAKQWSFPTSPAPSASSTSLPTTRLPILTRAGRHPSDSSRWPRRSATCRPRPMRAARLAKSQVARAAIVMRLAILKKSPFLPRTPSRSTTARSVSPKAIAASTTT